MTVELAPQIASQAEQRQRGAEPLHSAEAHCFYRHDAHELILYGHGGILKAEALRGEDSEFVLIDEPPALLLGYRFGELIPWSFAHYEWHSRDREQPLPPVEGPNESRAFLHIVLVDQTGRHVFARRSVTLSLDFTRTLHRAIQERARMAFDPVGRKRALDGLRRRYPRPEMLVAHSVARCYGSR
jgi:hypothetical protein